MLDLIIKNATYPDFINNKMVEGDIGIKNGVIFSLEKTIPEEHGKSVIDIKGLTLSPGFIDIHMHEENFKDEGPSYAIANQMLKQGVTTCVAGQCGIQYQSVKDFRKTIFDLGGAPVNYITFTGYNYFREKAGVDHYSPIDSQLHQSILKQIEEELNYGSFGISFGIEYDPGITTEEIIDTLNYFEDNRIIAAAHYRDDAENALNSIHEMIEIQERTGKPFQISHLSSCAAMGQMKECLDAINNAIRKGQDINFDTYPYSAFCTTIGSEVFAEGFLERYQKSYEDILLTEEPYKNVYCTKEIFEECRKRYPEMLAVVFAMNEDEITKAITNRCGMIASDGILSHGNGHPRAAGTFPRLLGHYVRERKEISLIDALRKISSRPARRLKLSTKGNIQIGYDADLTIFDKDIIIDQATYTDSSKPPLGVKMVFIGGKLALEDGNIINGTLGNFIERGK